MNRVSTICENRFVSVIIRSTNVKNKTPPFVHSAQKAGKRVYLCFWAKGISTFRVNIFPDVSMLKIPWYFSMVRRSTFRP